MLFDRLSISDNTGVHSPWTERHGFLETSLGEMGRPSGCPGRLVWNDSVVGGVGCPQRAAAGLLSISC